MIQNKLNQNKMNPTKRKQALVPQKCDICNNGKLYKNIRQHRLGKRHLERASIVYRRCPAVTHPWYKAQEADGEHEPKPNMEWKHKRENVPINVKTSKRKRENVPINVTINVTINVKIDNGRA
jgi:hypothetical protein